MITDKQLKHNFYLINNLIKAEEMNQFKFTDNFLKTFEEKIFSNENQNKENNFSNSFLVFIIFKFPEVLKYMNFKPSSYFKSGNS